MFIVLTIFQIAIKKNIEKWLNNKNFFLINQDVKENIILKIDKIWHFACPGSPKIYQKDPIRTAKTNFLGTLNMLELARISNAKLIMASTSEIYGNPKYHPQREDYWGYVNPIGIRSCYKEGKRFAESLCFDYLRTYETEVKIARIFNTYGPNMMPNDGRVVSNFICQALTNQPLCINGDGSQTRAFCYIDDLIEGLIKLMDSKISGPINFGNPKEELSILNLANLIKQKINPNISLQKREFLEDEPIRRKPDIEAASKYLNWEPKVNLESGLDKTIKYFRGVV